MTYLYEDDRNNSVLEYYFGFTEEELKALSAALEYAIFGSTYYEKFDKSLGESMRTEVESLLEEINAMKEEL